MKTPKSRFHSITLTQGRARKGLLALFIGIVLLFSAERAAAGRYYAGGGRVAVAGPRGVAVAGPNGYGVARRPATMPLPRGYVAGIPGGYRSAYYRGYNCYYAGGVYYRPEFYGGSTVYVVVP